MIDCQYLVKTVRMIVDGREEVFFLCWGVGGSRRVILLARCVVIADDRRHSRVSPYSYSIFCCISARPP